MISSGLFQHANTICPYGVKEKNVLYPQPMLSDVSYDKFDVNLCYIEAINDDLLTGPIAMKTW